MRSSTNMKKYIFISNILMLLLTGIMLFTNTLKHRISTSTFDKLMILYGIGYLIIIISFIFKLIKNNKNY